SIDWQAYPGATTGGTVEEQASAEPRASTTEISHSDVIEHDYDEAARDPSGGDEEKEQTLEAEPEAFTPVEQTESVQDEMAPDSETQVTEFESAPEPVAKPSGLKDSGARKRLSSSFSRIAAAEQEQEGGEALESQVVDYSADAPSTLQEGPKRVLVVDDIPVNQKLLLLHLKRLGYEADVASNGQEALDMIGNHQYELVLMDCDMPVMSGFEA